MRIIHCFDGSEGAVAAGRLLAVLPLSPTSTITVLTVVQDRHLPGSGVCREILDEILDRATETLAVSNAGIERLVVRGRPATEIIRAAECGEFDLVAMGSHGLSGLERVLLGSVSELVARHAPCPVLVVRGTGVAPKRVIVGVDGSEGSERALNWLRSFPFPPGCEVRLVTLLANLHEIAREHLLVSPPLSETIVPLDEWQRERAIQRLSEAAAMFEGTGVTVVTEIRSGDAAMGLLEVAADEGADLIVVGSHTPSRLERFFLSGVSHQVVCHAKCSVLVVRGAAEA